MVGSINNGPVPKSATITQTSWADSSTKDLSGWLVSAPDGARIVVSNGLTWTLRDGVWISGDVHKVPTSMYTYLKLLNTIRMDWCAHNPVFGILG